MAADRSRLAAALAYRQAEEERRRRMMESVPGLVTTPAQPAPRADFRTNLENLSIGLGEGLTNQLEGVKGIITDPVGTAKGVYEAGRAVIRDPSVIADALRYTAQKATSGPLGAGEVIGEMLGPRKGGPMMQELDVYHATPHRFPATEANPLGEFDASKIGTGEGGSVYGKGTYFTSSPKFAKEFARHVGEPRLSLKGQELERGTPDYEAAMLVDSMGLQEAQKYVKRATTDESEKVSGHFKTVDAALSKITKKSDVKNLGLGQIYKADLPDEMIEKMIVYDKPINKQSNYVKAALEKAGINTQTEMYAGPVIQGQEKAIAAAGIPGMVYREKGGPRNFVVFPGEEKKVRILERDGQKAPPQKIAQALEAAPDYRMTHRPMSDAGGASRLHNAYESFGEDIYGPKALQYFGAGDPREAKVVTALKRLRDNPDAEVTIYRGVPKDATGEIGKGDWVTLDRSVAAEYGDKVLTKKVKAKDITTWPDSLLEFGYYPEN